MKTPGKYIRWDDQKIARIWNYYASNRSYDNQYFSNHSGAFILKELQRYTTFEGDILDFGCGPGYMIGHLLGIVNSGSVSGLDFSEESISQVNKKYSENPTFKKALCVKKLPSLFPDSSIDIIISIEVIEHLNDDKITEMLKEAKRILRPEGTLIITTPNEENLDANNTICPDCGCIFNRWQHIRTWEKVSLSRCLEKSGFSVTIAKAYLFNNNSNRIKNAFISIFKKMIGKNSPTPTPHLFVIATKPSTSLI
jgi:ubiquinone/menaquinone biosynthesis C-methylase UbiE